MRGVLFSSVSLLLLVLGCGDGPGEVPAPLPEPTPPSVEVPVEPEPIEFPAVAVALLERHNELRTRVDAKPLSLDPKLVQAAEEHCDWMSRNNRLSHQTNEKGRETPAKRIEQAGYVWVMVGENIAAGQPTVDSVMRAWERSAGHRNNLLNPGYTQCGFAKSAGERPYWCAVFARPGDGRVSSLGLAEDERWVSLTGEPTE